MIGDLHSAALIGRDGSLDWLCLPRFDSSACFAALLDTPEAGRWLLAPAEGGMCTRRRYVEDSLVLETEWQTSTGLVRVIDFMPVRDRAPDVVRVVEGVSGTVRMRGELKVRFDYGSVLPWVERAGGRWRALAGPDALWLDTSAPLTGVDASTVSDFTVRAGEQVPFVLTWNPSYQPAPAPVDAVAARAATLAFWQEWGSRCSYTGPYEPAVRRSLATLKALTYRPTGGIVAAATTSLPEQLGGGRNWDYRYCWLRDTAFTLNALAGAGYHEEAAAWRDWLLRAVAGDPADLRIMYSLTGRRRLTESELPWLAGYEGSTPVRIGNEAAGQFQLDVWGEVLDGLNVARQHGLAPDQDAWDLQVGLTEFLEGAWRNEDASLWEVRGPHRHFTHSKVMAWVAFDRMAATARRTGMPAPVERWEAARDQVHAQVCAQGFDTDRGTFTQYYGSKGLDAALLLLPKVGFLPAADPRVLGTIAAVQRELTEDGLVMRYRPEADPAGAHGTVDGLAGTEGAFLACSFWLADALAVTGRAGQARELFERLLSLRNDVGLLSEEWDPVARRQLGNVPQAFSHLALVDTALDLDPVAPPDQT